VNLRDDEGTAIVEFLWLGLLLLIPLAYLILSLFQLQRGAFAVADASRAAGRAWVSAPTGADRDQAATLAATLALKDEGLTLPDNGLALTCVNLCCPGTGSLHVTVSIDVTLPGVAVFGSDLAPVTVTGKHAEVIDRFATAPDSCQR
jgi:Flp pilus assembly protein TadG